ncbi:SHOCT domain-containing protein [Streptomyces sp. NPDC097981]|uniref:SHOCT domain-containing protein n=1 Tax=Streptomyces sp. NPDC097981 TaxID=3155428 RepID=UPI00332AC4BD
MFIRPVGVRVEPADRPEGRPLLRGLLSRAAGATAPPATAETAAAGTVVPEEPATGPGAPPGGLAAELAELAKLAREGLLTPEEFTEAKARLLHP